MIEHVFPAHALIIASLVALTFVLGILCCFGMLCARRTGANTRPWDVSLIVCVTVFCAVALTACDAPINPVRYQPVPYMVTKPCFQGRTAPAEAVVLTDPVCGTGDAQCVIQAGADINELKREAREYRNLFKECSK